MNTINHKLASVALAAGLAFGLQGVSHAEVYVDDIAIQGSTLIMTKSLNWGLFGAFVESEGSSNYIRLSAMGIAEQYRFFDATPGAVVGADFAISAPAILGNDAVDPRSFEVYLNSGESRYFAYWDSRDAHIPGPDALDAYGWFKLTGTAQGIVVEASATSVGDPIAVGSITAVPEPGTQQLFALAAVGALALQLARKARGTAPARQAT